MVHVRIRAPAIGTAHRITSPSGATPGAACCSTQVTAHELLPPPCRVSELEEQLGTAQASLQTSKAAGSALKADNISLYEKIRYLQRYKKQAQGAGMIMRVDSDGLPQQEKVSGSQAEVTCSCAMIRHICASVNPSSAKPVHD